MNRLDKILVRASQLVSIIYDPWYLPLVGILILLHCGYLGYLTTNMSLLILGAVYFFTILLPYIGVYIYRHVNGVTRHEMGQRERRLVPYVLCIICYGALLYLMLAFHFPALMMFVIAGALILQIVCAIVNQWYKISTHAAASAAFVGTLLALSLLLNVYMMGWICFSVVMCGVVCSARMILRQQTMGELALGSLVGLLTGWTSIIMLFQIAINSQQPI